MHAFLIKQLLFCSEGFTSAPKLSRKAVALFAMLSEQLSAQPHYDFGMRALKAALAAAGAQKRAAPQADESDVLISAMRDSTLPKLTQADALLFAGLVQVCVCSAACCVRYCCVPAAFAMQLLCDEAMTNAMSCTLELVLCYGSRPIS